MNEILAWFIGCIISFTGCVYIYYKYTDADKFINLKFIIVFLACCCVLTSIYYFDIKIIGVISYFIFCPILYALIKRENLKKFIYYSFAIWVYGIILDLIAMIVVSFLHYFYNFDIYGYTFEITLSLVIFCMLFTLAHIKIIKQFTNNLYEKLTSIEYFDLFFIFFVIITFGIGIVLFINLNHLNISLLLILLIFLLIIMFVFLIKYRINSLENAIFIKTLKDNYEFYVKMEDENRIFRHNLNAKLNGIKSVSNQKSRALLNELIKEINHNIAVSNLLKIVPYGVGGIIYEKLYPYMESLDITIDNSIEEDLFDVLKARRYNVFVEKMSIALDNAVEASLKSNEKVLIVNLYSLDNEIVVEIENSFSNMVNLEEMGKIGYSTKGSKRGLGLFSTFRNSEASVEVKICNNIFISKIAVRRKNILV